MNAINARLSVHIKLPADVIQSTAGAGKSILQRYVGICRLLVEQACVYICIYKHMHIYINIYLRIRKYKYIHRMCMYIYIYQPVNIYTYTHIQGRFNTSNYVCVGELR